MSQKITQVSNMTVLVIGVVLAIALSIVFAMSTSSQDSRVSAHDGVDHANEEEAEAHEQETEGMYHYTAQPGDSYTKIARKAVQTYGIVEDVSLSQAQIIFAETVLTQRANEPLLNVGQEVSIGEELIAETVKNAEELSDEAEAAWEGYVASVDFNTDSVGEPR